MIVDIRISGDVPGVDGNVWEGRVTVAHPDNDIYKLYDKYCLLRVSGDMNLMPLSFARKIEAMKKEAAEIEAEFVK